MIRAETGGTSAALFRRLTRKAALLGRAAAEMRRPRSNAEPPKWHRPDLLWPLLLKD